MIKAVRVLEKYWWLCSIIVIIIAGCWISYIGTQQAIWFDENYSITLARQSFADILSLTGVDAHPPLYYLLLKIWANSFGWSEFSLRLMSVIVASAGMFVAVALTRHLFSAKVALAVMPFIAFAPFIVRYGYEVRMYALAFLIGVLATYVLVKARSRKVSSIWLWSTYAVLVAAGMYTLYMTLVIWLAHLLWIVFTTNQKRSLIRSPMILSYAGAVLLFLPYLPTFIYQNLHSALPGVGSELTLTRLVNTFSMLTVYTPEWQLGGWISLVLILAIILFGMAVYQIRKTPQYQGVILLATLVVVPTIFFAAVSLPPRTPIYIERYMAHISVYYYLLITTVAVLWINKSKDWKSYSLLISIATFAIVGNFQLLAAGNLNYERLQLPETKELRKSVSCNNNMTIVADDPYTYIDSEYYFRDCNLTFYSESDVAYRGGYAPLHKSPQRIENPSSIHTDTLVHLRWDKPESDFHAVEAYQLVETRSYGKQIVDVYKRANEG